MPTIRDVARAAGVSVGTVSATINGTSGVSEKLAKRVWDAVAQVGYTPDGVARSLRLGRTNTIGLMVSDICNPFFGTLARSVEAAANAAGYSVILCNTDEDPDRELEFLSVLRVQRVAGIIFSPSGFSAAYQEKLRHFTALPLVMVDRFVPDMPFDAVVVDNYAAGLLASEHIARLGHRRIAIIGGRPHVSTAEERLRGYRDTLAKYALPFDESLVLAADFRIEMARAAVQRLLTRVDPPTAIFAANNLMTIGTMQAIRDMGLRCPRDISVAGIDDFSASGLIEPLMTTVEQPIEAMGAAAMKCLLARLEAGSWPPTKANPAKVTVLEPRLLVRESCRRLAQEAAAATL